VFVNGYVDDVEVFYVLCDDIVFSELVVVYLVVLGYIRIGFVVGLE